MQLFLAQIDEDFDDEADDDGDDDNVGVDESDADDVHYEQALNSIFLKPSFHLKLRKCSLPLQMFSAPVLKTHQIFFIHILLTKHAAVCMHCHSKVPTICLLILIEINLPFLQFSLKK